MKRYDFTVVGTAATVSILHVNQMPECGKSTPVFGGSLTEYSNGGMGLNICAGLARLGEAVYPVFDLCPIIDSMTFCMRLRANITCLKMAFRIRQRKPAARPL